MVLTWVVAGSVSMTEARTLLGPVGAIGLAAEASLPGRWFGGAGSRQPRPAVGPPT